MVSKDGCGLDGGTMEDKKSHVKFRAEVDRVDIGSVEVGWILSHDLSYYVGLDGSLNRK